MKISIPRLYSPFPSFINTHVKETHEHNMQWLQQHNLFPDKESYNLYDSQYHTYLMARMCPTAEKELLFAIADFSSLLFIVDDDLEKKTGHKVASVQSRQALEKFISTSVSVMKGRKKIQTEPGKEIFSALADSSMRLYAFGGKRWHDNFIQSFADTFNAAIWELENVAKGYCPTLEEYMKYRSFFAGANLATDMAEIVANINLPEEIMQHPAVQQLLKLSRNLVSFANDMFSLSKEIVQNNTNDKHNLVFIMQEKYNLSLEEAILKAAEFHDEQAREFISLSSDLPVFGAGIDKEISRYITALTYVVKGNIDWSENETTRYIFSYSE
ncbi:terpene synthase family protein [Sinomicrobium sp. M5D2P9]